MRIRETRGENAESGDGENGRYEREVQSPTKEVAETKGATEQAA